MVEHDGLIVGCAALYPYGDGHGELACLAVHPQYRRWGYGEQLMKRIEARARRGPHQAPLRADDAYRALVHRARVFRAGSRRCRMKSAWSQPAAPLESLRQVDLKPAKAPPLGAFALAASAIIRRSTTALLEH